MTLSMVEHSFCWSQKSGERVELKDQRLCVNHLLMEAAYAPGISAYIQEGPLVWMNVRLFVLFLW